MNTQKLTTQVVPLAFFSTFYHDHTFRMECISVIVHSGSSPHHGHYTCFLKRTNGKWYYYDDMARDYELIGSFTDMLKYNNAFVMKNMVSCIYLRRHLRQK